MYRVHIFSVLHVHLHVHICTNIHVHVSYMYVCCCHDRSMGDHQGMAEASQFDQMMQRMVEGTYTNPGLESMPVWNEVHVHVQYMFHTKMYMLVQYYTLYMYTCTRHCSLYNCMHVYMYTCIHVQCTCMCARVQHVLYCTKKHVHMYTVHYHACFFKTSTHSC